MTAVNSCVSFLDSLMLRENATARRIGASPAGSRAVAGGTRALGEPVPAADDLYRVVKVQFAVVVSERD